MKSYSAATKEGMFIITVLADSEDQARVKINEELSRNPSRLPYLDKWIKDGKIIKQAS